MDQTIYTDHMSDFEMIHEEINELINLLKIEKQEDLAQYKDVMENLSLEEKRHKGVTWYPVKMLEDGFGMGDYPFVIIERQNLQNMPHQFSSGQQVTFFTNKQNQRQSIDGVIQFINRDKMKVSFYVDELPDWVDDGKLGVDLLFDETTYLYMQGALEEILKAEEKSDTIKLLSTIIGTSEPQFSNKDFIEIPQLNPSQNKAVQNMVGAHHLSILHGPPGTGKTTTLIQGIKILAKEGKKILICAPSNAAVDLLTRKLVEEEQAVVRVGNLSRIDEELYQHTIEGKLKSDGTSKRLKDYKKQAAELRKMALKYKRNFGKEERIQRNLILKEARTLMKDAIKLEDDLVRDIVSSSPLVTTTLAGSRSRYLEKQVFDVVIIDESAQGLEPACWIPILKSKKVILAGDIFQLPPTVKSQKAAKLGLEKTLMERCIGKGKPAVLLDTQYRMNQTIMGFSNEYFYEGKLQAHETNSNHQLEGIETQLEFMDTAGASMNEELNPESQSSKNLGEVDLVKKIIHEKIDCFKGQSIGVISPYRAQIKELNDALKNEEAFQELQLQVNTIDSFQGQERDVIIISLVRSNDDNQIGFLKDYRRMNVAITRAKKLLIVVGDSATIGSDSFYNQFLSYCDDHGQYRTAWEMMY